MTSFNIAPIGSSTHWMGPATWYRRPLNPEGVRQRPPSDAPRSTMRVPVDTTRGMTVDVHL